jgi:hypothetical protein
LKSPIEEESEMIYGIIGAYGAGYHAAMLDEPKGTLTQDVTVINLSQNISEDSETEVIFTTKLVLPKSIKKIVMAVNTTFNHDHNYNGRKARFFDK